MLSRPDLVVVDDHVLLAEALVSNLAANGCSALAREPAAATPAALAELAPRLVLLDLDLGAGRSSCPLIAGLRRAGLPVLVLTGVTDRLRIAEAIEAGAIGYQPKAADLATLLEAVRAALQAVTAAGSERRLDPLDPAGSAQLLAELARSRHEAERNRRPFESLTSREAEALWQLCAGHTVPDIARAWVVSEATVRSHVRGVLVKLNVGSQVAAVALAATHGWTYPQPLCGPNPR